MGILDDAIRQHLDLKRRLGAEDDELKRLEDEAFGPPSRPGEPDFPGSDGEDGVAGAETSTGEGVAVGDRPADPPTEHAPEPAEVTDLKDEPDGPEGEDREGAPEEAAGFYDQREPEPADEAESDGEQDLDLELDLDLDDEAEVTPAPPTSEPPIEALDTVEHPYEGAIGETSEDEVVEDDAKVVEDEAQGEEGEDEEEEEVVEGEVTEEGDEEDVLEETPEFLRDAPEDDELWFEQGEPKDFDF